MHPFEDEFRLAGDVPESAEAISFTGTDIQKRIRAGKKVPDWASFPEVIEELQKTYPPPSKQGFTIFCTGLSGAGKSTIAKILYARFLEIGTRPVKRIGFVASEITKNRGIAICAPIAPYEKTRAAIRRSIEAHGGFIEVHVATPIAECERRDRKGMYARARAGLLKGFTGVDDPYEDPPAPEIRIDTTTLTPDEAAQEVMLFISRCSYI